jgi:osmotically-inducible protein OsmY
MNALECVHVEYPDDDVQSRVASFLGTRQLHDLSRLNVAVRNGTVTLDGTVGSFYEKQLAMDSCRRVAGVRSLVDQVQVRKEPDPGSTKKLAPKGRWPR